MWGAIIGDLAGSIYEFDQVKKVKPVVVSNIIDENSFFSDDTILTIAILDAMLNDKNFERYLKKYGNMYADYKPEFKPYFKTSFSPGFLKWIKSSGYEASKGNGAMMRISPVGYLSCSIKEVVQNSKKATICSHNCQESIDAATLVAMIIFLARKGHCKEKIISMLNLQYKYSEFTKFNVTCKETMDNCLYALFTSNSFEEAVCKVISYGGDTDTNACIVGSMAESLYGIDDNLIKKASNKIPEEFVRILHKGYQKIGER